MEVQDFKLKNWQAYFTAHPKPYTDWCRDIEDTTVPTNSSMGFIRIFHADQNGTLHLTTSCEFDDLRDLYINIYGTYVLPFKMDQIDQAKQHVDQFLLQYEALKAFI